MDLKRALELRAEYAGKIGTIHVDNMDYVCLNDLESFFPSKRIDHWMANQATKEYIVMIERVIIPEKSGIIKRRGKSGGTWAHHLIAFEFAMWLSPEFKLKVYQEYIDGTQHKKGWNIKRYLAAMNYQIMTAAIKDAPPLSILEWSIRSGKKNLRKYTKQNTVTRLRAKNETDNRDS